MVINEDKENNAKIALKKKCKYCGKLFIPNRPWQDYCNPGTPQSHQKAYWKQIQNDKAFLMKKIERLEGRLGIK